MADIINLNTERKKRTRQKAIEKAAENRVRFGRTKAQKALDKSQQDKAQKELDAVRRSGKAEDPPDKN